MEGFGPVRYFDPEEISKRITMLMVQIIRHRTALEARPLASAFREASLGPGHG